MEIKVEENAIKVNKSKIRNKVPSSRRKYFTRSINFGVKDDHCRLLAEQVSQTCGPTQFSKMNREAFFAAYGDPTTKSVFKKRLLINRYLDKSFKIAELVNEREALISILVKNFGATHEELDRAKGVFHGF